MLESGRVASARDATLPATKIYLEGNHSSIYRTHSVSTLGINLIVSGNCLYALNCRGAILYFDLRYFEDNLTNFVQVKYRTLK